jgi:stage II sporulation protein D
VPGVSRLAPRLGAAFLLLSAGAAASVLAAGPSAVRGTTTVTTAATTTSAAKVVLAISGHGWGHGLGMSQWGAYGYAKHGWTYDLILAHYYSGTTLGPAPVSTVRVLLAQKQKVTLTSTTPWSVTDATGTKTSLEPGALTLKQKIVVDGQPLLSPVAFVGKAPLAVEGKAFRGRLVVSSDGKRVQVVDVLPLEQYLKGVVPSEMPFDWPAEALQAQSVAARSYALANLTKNRDFDLHGDTRDQVYGGIAAEQPSATAAIAATKGQVVLYKGKVADTLFFSTSGGRTASSLDATGVAVPYLASVADPYDTMSPVHDWGPMLFDGTKVAAQLKLPGSLSDLTAVDGLSGRAKTVTGIGADGVAATVTGAQFRSLLELRSTWFTSALFSLLPVAKTMTFGGAVTLSGFAKGADAVELESKPFGQEWAPAGELILGADGSFSTIVKPSIGTQYRISSGAVRAGLAKIGVAPRVDAQLAPTGLTGTEKPAVPGSPVQLQRQDGTIWTTISSTVTDTSGAWAFSGTLQPGTYRVRCAPGQGLAAGVSASVQAP